MSTVLHCDVCNEETNLNMMQLMGDSLVCDWCYSSPSINSGHKINLEAYNSWNDIEDGGLYSTYSASDPQLTMFQALLEALGSTVDKVHQRELIVAYNEYQNAAVATTSA